MVNLMTSHDDDDWYNTIMIDDYVYLCEIPLLLSSVFKYKVPIEQQSSTCEIIDIVHSTKD